MSKTAPAVFEPVKVAPFYNWVGGKRRLMDFIQENTPESFVNYHEPFLGGGAVALDLLMRTPPAVDGHRKTFYLSDLNAELIATWTAVRDDVDQLIELIEEHRDRHDRQYFLAVRSWDVDGVLAFKTDTERAARFLYILQTSFNGQWNENAEGFCKASFGFDEPRIPKDFFSNLQAIHSLLNAHNVVLSHQSFEAGEEFIQSGDFVYLDPPYAVDDDDGAAGWDGYVAGGAGDAFQPVVVDYIDMLTIKGAYALASNSNTATTRQLYKGWNQIQKSIIWSGGGVNGRRVIEKLFANYLLYVALGYEMEQELEELPSP